MITFASLREFDLWRHERASEQARQTIEVDVVAALREVGRPQPDLPAGVARIIAELCRFASLPRTVQEIVPDGMTYITFLRRWRDAIPERPKKFLGRVRLRHARRLVEQDNLAPKEAAFRAGYASTWHMRQAILQRARDNAGVSDPPVPER